MSENPHPQPDLTAQFRELGENLKNIFQSAWQSEEARKLRQEISEGMSELGKAASQAVDEFNASEAGQKLKSEAQDFKARVESGEVEAKAREELGRVMAFINTELNKFNRTGSPEPVEPADEQEG
jgi:hypothetical protein